jgi:hypothetical protein
MDRSGRTYWYFCELREILRRYADTPRKEQTMSPPPQDPIPLKGMTERLSHRLANFKLSDAVITALAERVLIDGLSIGRFDPCIYGLCVDYFTNKPPRLDHLSAKLGVVKWEVFPYGIIDWDRFHVRVAFNVDELEGKGLMRDFGG